MIKEFGGNSYLFGTNAAFVEELYDIYLDNPTAIPDDWRMYFDNIQGGSVGKDISSHEVAKNFVGFRGVARAGSAPVGSQTHERKQVSVLQLINAYRFLGVRRATVDPLQR
jgi:2-oxoglutarate dehydrogenase E1 component